ncbi:MAG: hypothetical protein RI571_10065 [Roseovarius sp.]|nr:hypothetical protein [Roseovarius sp.]
MDYPLHFPFETKRQTDGSAKTKTAFQMRFVRLNRLAKMTLPWFEIFAILFIGVMIASA